MGRGVVAGAQLDQRGGQDGAFEMQMQLGLGQAADEVLDLGHILSLTGRRELLLVKGVILHSR